ncbi:unnamed protein product [Adineta ricciae]|uniref:Uncharacterized protein n=1 Tax=Adineta ricciae TaxID=249248 RepID=A0A815IZ71_ADIRI|nr:unnamed protein product [Adineta ricciae]CAF1648027.1 unnamed protein product [Adineta ricciae]
MYYMKFLLLAVVVFLNVINEGSTSDIICASTTDTCTPAETSKLQCEGTGKIHVIPDECINDGGIDAVGDSLEIYCVCNRARFCLSGEACPWRNPTTNEVDNSRTCSRAGLTSSYMANAWCNQWKNQTNYNCCYDGFIGF